MRTDSTQSKFLILITVLLVWPAPALASGKVKVPTTELECKARGGDWIVLGLSYPNKPKVCDLKTTDVGVKCADSKDCEGVCVAPETAKVGSKSTGQCSPYVLNFGTLLLINNGVVEQWSYD